MSRIETALLEVASAWGDVDESVVRAVDDLRSQLDELHKTIDEAVQLELERQRETS